MLDVVGTTTETNTAGTFARLVGPPMNGCECADHSREHEKDTREEYATLGQALESEMPRSGLPLRTQCGAGGSDRCTRDKPTSKATTRPSSVSELYPDEDLAPVVGG